MSYSKTIIVSAVCSAIVSLAVGISVSEHINASLSGDCQDFGKMRIGDSLYECREYPTPIYAADRKSATEMLKREREVEVSK